MKNVNDIQVNDPEVVSRDFDAVIKELDRQEVIMKNIHVLPTEKPSRLCYVICTEKSTLTLFEDAMDKASRFFPQNIYITSNEEIKYGDWFIALDGSNDIYKANKVWLDIIKENPNPSQKIILTTDQDLIKDGIQAIDDEFLEWFVKNQSCESVEVNRMCYGALSGFADAGYKIILPKEEPKQETLEEAAREYYKRGQLGFEKAADTEMAFLRGAKWQQEQILDFLYSEITERRDYSASKMCEKVIEFIEQFKKK